MIDCKRINTSKLAVVTFFKRTTRNRIRRNKFYSSQVCQGKMNTRDFIVKWGSNGGW